MYVIRLKDAVLRSGVLSYKFCNVKSGSLTIGKVEARRASRTPRGGTKEELGGKSNICRNVRGWDEQGIGMSTAHIRIVTSMVVCLWWQLSTQHSSFFFIPHPCCGSIHLLKF